MSAVSTNSFTLISPSRNCPVKVVVISSNATIELATSVLASADIPPDTTELLTWAFISAIVTATSATFSKSESSTPTSVMASAISFSRITSANLSAPNVASSNSPAVCLASIAFTISAALDATLRVITSVSRSGWSRLTNWPSPGAPGEICSSIATANFLATVLVIMAARSCWDWTPLETVSSIILSAVSIRIAIWVEMTITFWTRPSISETSTPKLKAASSLAASSSPIARTQGSILVNWSSVKLAGKPRASSRIWGSFETTSRVLNGVTVIAWVGSEGADATKARDFITLPVIMSVPPRERIRNPFPASLPASLRLK